MQILIPARIDRHLKAQISSLAKHVLTHMVAEADRETLMVTVRFDSMLAHQGTCEPLWEEDIGLEKQAVIAVTLNRSAVFNEDQFLRLVSHEFVHVGQMANGSLQFRDDGEYWHGEFIDDSLYRNPNHERPEEVEAYALEGRMLGSWKRSASFRELLN
jgi:hypothetical protein